MLEPEDNFEFLDLVVESFGDTAKQLIAEAGSMKNLNTICYGSLLAACILHCEKLGIELAQESVHRLVDEFSSSAANASQCCRRRPMRPCIRG